MNKETLISQIASNLDVSKVEGSRILNCVLDTIISGVKENGKCVLPGIGNLLLVDVKESSGVAMGKPWNKPAHKKLKLKLSSQGKDIGNPSE